jgi:signal peptidase I
VAFYLGNKILIKRCIAVSGDFVNIDADGNVYVNDELIDEPYLTEKSLGECDLTFPYQVPESRCFMLGDDREVSVDSRNSAVGSVSEEQIVGRIIYRVWPLSALGAVN